MPVELTPFTARDLALLETWLTAPHVARWWRPHRTVPLLELLRAGQPVPDRIRPWRIDLDGRPVGYAQDYDAMQDGGAWDGVEGVGPGTRGVELLLGEADVLNRKHGRAAIAALAATLFAGPGIDRLVADPHPDDWPAIIAFKRAGFRERGRRQFPSGPVMVLTAAKAVWKP